MKRRIRVWDLPTRLFHWLLVLSIAGSFATGLTGGGWIIWHERLGYLALALILFRIGWGFIGARTSRFSDFIRGPGAIIRYLKTGINPTHGHSPLGALAVIALLLAVLVQAMTGLIIDDEIANKGPLADKVPNAWVSLASTIHRMNKWVLGGLIALHLCAIAFYTFVKKDSLVGPMVSGTREVDEPLANQTEDTNSRPVAASIVAIVCVAFVYWLTQVFPKT
jgi:cytochrome b